jgi:hypothetical protein
MNGSISYLFSLFGVAAPNSHYMASSDYMTVNNIFLNLHSGGWNQGPLDTAATNGLLRQPRVIMMMDKSVE